MKSPKKYKHIYFDLDRTLWDFDANSKNAFASLFDKYKLARYYKDLDHYFEIYTKHNNALWALYREGKMNKAVLSKTRFEKTLAEVGINDEELAREIGEDYIQISPYQKILFPGTHEILGYLKEKYQLYIITNGFKEVQYKKLNNTNLNPYFSKVFISEEIGYKKPHPEIFRYAITSVNAKKAESLMIGDDLEVDISGAKDFGLDQVFFNPEKIAHTKTITYEIQSLYALKDIL